MRTVLAMAALLGTLPAQDKPEFDAASIKPNSSVRIGIMIHTTKSGDFEATNVSLRNLVAYAYRVKEFQTIGGAKWIDSERYDVLAKPTPDGNMSDERNRIRMRSLLADRFQLVVHNETKDMPVYALVVAKNGPHMQPWNGDTSRQGINGQRGFMICSGVSMKSFAEWGLAPRLGNIVLDKTGLTGEFDFKLQYADDSPPKPGADPAETAIDPASPSLMSAIQEQLGLKLETQKAQVEVIVVDRAEKASAN
jgi:uncharacterized protein (TIGR03435 family)